MCLPRIFFAVYRLGRKTLMNASLLHTIQDNQFLFQSGHLRVIMFGLRMAAYLSFEYHSGRAVGIVAYVRYLVILVILFLPIKESFSVKQLTISSLTGNKFVLHCYEKKYEFIADTK